MNETDTLIIDQEKEGYRFSIEPFLLADFVCLRRGMRLLDIGTGCGVIPLLLSVREPGLQITAVEIQKPLYDRAMQNVAGNGLKRKIGVRHGDFLKLAQTLGSFDLIISNPPYRKINSGRLNSDKGKAIARHELTLTLPALIAKAAPLLERGGRMVLAYPPHRLDEVLSELRLRRLYPWRLRLVHGYRGAATRFFLVEAVKDQFAERVEKEPFYIYHPDGSYTRRMKKLYASLNHPCRSHRLREERNRACAG
ncbi:MAG: tRNA1(Val) (adenine(37)-N6)-methyltransferase [Nitrospinales bacterium]